MSVVHEVSEGFSGEAGRVLLVEDNRVLLQMTTMILRKAGHEVLTAETGAEGLALVRSESPELVLLDFNLPDMNGGDVCETMQADPALRDIPILLLTAENSPELARTCLDLGARDFVRKPIAPEELTARVRTHLGASRNARTLKAWKAEISRDLKMAGQLQRAIASTTPLFLPTLRARARYRPSLHVGGDFLDVQALPDGRVVIYLGDAAGHGVAASLVASLLKSELNMLIRQHPDARPFELCNQLAASLRRSIDDITVYATMILAIGDPVTRRFRVLRCGHPPPVEHGGQSFDWMAVGGVPIGFPSAGEPYGPDMEAERRFDEGSQLLFFSDGLLEAAEVGGEQLGADRLAAYFAEEAERLPGGWLDPLLERVEAAGYVFDDDCSLIEVHFSDSADCLFRVEVPLPELKLGDLVAEASQAVREAGHPDELLQRAELLMLEHLGNLVKHSRDDNMLILVEISRAGTGLHLLMSDTGVTWLDRADKLPDDALSESGRGLHILKTLSEGIELIPNASRSACRYRLSPRV